MISKGLKAAQITSAALWGANLAAVLLITAAQENLVPVLLGTSAYAEKALPVPQIAGAAISVVFGIISTLIVCLSAVRRTRLKSILLAVVYAMGAPLSILSSTVFTSLIANRRGVEYVATYAALTRLFSIASLIFSAPAAILFLFSLGRYFDAGRHSEAAE